MVICIFPFSGVGILCAEIVAIGEILFKNSSPFFSSTGGIYTHKAPSRLRFTSIISSYFSWKSISTGNCSSCAYSNTFITSSGEITCCESTVCVLGSMISDPELMIQGDDNGKRSKIYDTKKYGREVATPTHIFLLAVIIACSTFCEGNP